MYAHVSQGRLDDEMDESSSTAALVRLAQCGDREAFGRLVERFQSTVHALARRRLGHPSEAAELTQEVFLHAMKRIGQLREPERFAGWLKQMTVRLAINRATRRVPPASIERSVLENRADDAPGEPLERLIADERAGRLWEGLALLADIDRETLVAFYIHGLSVVEVAERHEVPVGTVKRRLHIARKRLKVVLQRDHDDWSDEDENEVTTEPERVEVRAVKRRHRSQSALVSV